MDHRATDKVLRTGVAAVLCLCVTSCGGSSAEAPPDGDHDPSHTGDAADEPAIELIIGGGTTLPFDGTTTTITVVLARGGVPATVTLARDELAPFATYPADASFTLAADEQSLTRTWCISADCWGNQPGAHTLTAVATYADGRTATRSLSLDVVVSGTSPPGGVPQGPVSYLPVIPGARGFGLDSRAGRGGTVHRVTNLSSSGAGSLAACVQASGPRVCVFEVSGYIDIAPQLTVVNPYLTIAGQTAPSPGITLRGGALIIETSEVLVQHLRVRVGDGDGADPENRDAIDLDAWRGPIHDVVIDHCSFSWSLDEMMSTWHQVDRVTFSNNIFAQPLDDSLHPEGPHGYGPLLGGETGSISLIGNVIAHAADRSPNSRARSYAMVNNIIYNWRWYGTRLTGDPYTGYPATDSSLVGNVYLKGADTSNTGKGVDLYELNDAAGVYLHDNAGVDASADPWSIVQFSTGDKSLYYRSSPPASSWPEGLVAVPTANDQAYDYVLAYAGARPADRDAIDVRVLDQVKSRTGQIINCVAADGSSRCAKNGGGWPTLAQHVRALTLPPSPDEDDDGDGYTNLEEWLHQLSAQVEGL